MAKKNALPRYRVTIRDAASWEVIFQDVCDAVEMGPILNASLGPGHGIETARTRGQVPVTTDKGCERLVQISLPRFT